MKKGKCLGKLLAAAFPHSGMWVTLNLRGNKKKTPSVVQPKLAMSRCATCVCAQDFPVKSCQL